MPVSPAFSPAAPRRPLCHVGSPHVPEASSVPEWGRLRKWPRMLPLPHSHLLDLSLGAPSHPTSGRGHVTCFGGWDVSRRVLSGGLRSMHSGTGPLLLLLELCSLVKKPGPAFRNTRDPWPNYTCSSFDSLPTARHISEASRTIQPPAAHQLTTDTGQSPGGISGISSNTRTAQLTHQIMS